MTATTLATALTDCASGLYPLEAGVTLLIAEGTFLNRDDFAHFVHVGTSITEPGIQLASIDWEAAISALDAGELPGSGGEKRMLRLAASLAADIPVTLGEAVTGIDHRNVRLLVKAIHRAAGRRQLPAAP